MGNIVADGLRQRALIRCSIDYYSEFKELIGELRLQMLAHSLQQIASNGFAENESILRPLAEGFFAIVYPVNIQDIDRWVALWEEQLQKVARKENIPYVLSLSVGVYEGIKSEKLLPEYVRKTAFAQRFGRIFTNPSVGYYDGDTFDDFLNRRYLEMSMRTALQEHQFEVYLQPQYRLQDNSLAGTEALVRWNHPELGFLYPSTFIPLFERNRSILRLDFYMLEECCKLINAWHIKYHFVPPISVNFSRLHASTCDFTKRFLSITQRYEIKPKDLHVEWTESAFSGDEVQVNQIAKELRSEGFLIAMDDFGSGYSTLNGLADMPVDIIKLDKQFLNFEQKNERRKYLLTEVIQMARCLRYTVLMEGVEEKWQLKIIQDTGCEYVQGYLFGVPLHVRDFETLLS